MNRVKTSDYLLVDIGNTRIKWIFANSIEDRCIKPEAIVHRLNGDLNDLLDLYWRDLPTPSQVRIASVASDTLNSQLTDWVESSWQLTPELITQVPLSYLPELTPIYLDPTKFGVDRWLGLLALKQKYPPPAALVNCGSAITMDILGISGEHLGGLILPGIQLMQQTLLTDLSRVLPYKVSQKADIYLGNSTLSCIERGSLLAASGMIEKVMDYYQKLFNAEVSLVFSGGDAEILQENTSVQGHLDPLIVLKGLELL